ncbi:MAG: type transport system ATP-binding protein [Chloroflexota bacterium]|jgi:ABC-2 type transport system ATP-binding protein|nr:type transport system ATP-binding protein [Chloroflexota bacterium]
MMFPCVIETDKLSKSYGSFEAVRELSLLVEKGSITGFLGQNGAGKSTTIKMLLGMMRPSHGGGRVLGHDIADPKASLAMRQRIAYVAEDKRLYDYMTVGQLIAFTKAFYPTWREDVEKELLEEFRLPVDRVTKKLSKGMRTQTALLLAFSKGAELLVLDEPSEGLDPVIAERVLQLTVRAAADGASVFFSSHQIAEVEQIADRVLMIDRGRLVLDTSLDAVREKFRRIRAVYEHPESVDLRSLAGARRVHIDGRVLSVIASENVDAIAARLHETQGTAIEVLPVTLKEVLLDSIGTGK